MSRTFSINCGSVDNLNVSLRCGCRPKAFQIRCTLWRVMPDAAAIDRTLQCVALRGVDSKVLTMTASTTSSLMRRGAPLRGSSSRPATPSATNRERHLPTVALVRRSSRATWLFEQPLLQRSTISARTAKPCAVLRRVVQRSNVARSSGVIVNSTSGRPRPVRTARASSPGTHPP